MAQVRGRRQVTASRPRQMNTGTLPLPLLDAEMDTAPMQREPADVPGSRIIVGDAHSVLEGLATESIQCCVTSPPYWGLRDYSIDDQIGAEAVLTDYISNLCRIFEEVRRVLRADGTLWLNLGDSYTSGGRTWRAPDKKNGARAMSYRPQTPCGLKPKDLIGVPWRVAFALQAQGWYLRSDIVWYKPNCQPESVRDRPTQAHEYLFLLTKSALYRYRYEAIREPSDDGRSLRNKRTVWAVNTAPFPEAHFATFPPELITPAILAGTDPGDTVLDPFFGAGTVGLVSRQLKRAFVGIELKREYAEMAASRLEWPLERIETPKRVGGVDGQKPPSPLRQGLGVSGSAGLDRLRPPVVGVLPTDSAGPLSADL